MNKMTSPDQFYVPEDVTHLYHTPSYQQLNDDQKLCYNYLFSLMVCEQFSVFEHTLVDVLCKRVLQSNHIEKHQKIKNDIEFLMKDEVKHRKYFMKYLKKVSPERYEHSETYFTKMNPGLKIILKLLQHPVFDIRAFLWYVLAIEEYSVSIGNLYETSQVTTSSELNRDMLEMQLRHRNDERRHVPIQENLLTYWHDTQSRIKKHFDLQLFSWWLEKMRSPRISGVNVLKELVRVRPELRELESVMCYQVAHLHKNTHYQNQFIGPNNTPKLWTALERRPEAKSILKKQERFI